MAQFMAITMFLTNARTARNQRKSPLDLAPQIPVIKVLGRSKSHINRQISLSPMLKNSVICSRTNLLERL